MAALAAGAAPDIAELPGANFLAAETPEQVLLETQYDVTRQQVVDVELVSSDECLLGLELKWELAKGIAVPKIDFFGAALAAEGAIAGETRG